MRSLLDKTISEGRNIAMANFTKVYSFVSLIMVPQVSPLYFFLALFASVKGMTIAELAVSILFAAVVEIAYSAAYIRKAGTDIFVTQRRKRDSIFYVSIASFLIGFLALRALDAPYIISTLMLAYFINAIAAFLINTFFDKVSIHVWNISGPSIAILYVLGTVPFAVTLIAAAFVGYSRIMLKHHTIRQVALAFLVSLPLTYLIVFYLPILSHALFGI
jgi:membrane-associated phospholipid phosphatase